MKSWPTTLVSILSFLFMATFALAQVDEPDYGKEARFHDIYLKFNSEPTSDEEWSQVFTDAKPRIYTVTKGDTLWDVSKILFADPLFWPKIWSFNTQDILNPHEIKPNWKLQFMPGTLEAPPALVVAEIEGVKIPPPKKVYPPKAAFPPSIPEYRFNVPIKERTQFKRVDRSALSRTNIFPLPVEIRDSNPDIKGEVIEFEDGANVASESRDLYIRLDDDLPPGKYTVAKSVERSRYGYVIVFSAEVETTELINESENIYRAKIIKMINPVEVGDELIVGSIPDVVVDETPLAKEAPIMRIVGGYRSPTDSIFAAYSFVFLNAGIKHGLTVGESLNVYQDPKIRWEKTKIKKAFRLVGKLKLLKVDESVSTGYVLNTTTELREGDFVGILASETPVGSASGEGDADLILE